MVSSSMPVRDLEWYAQPRDGVRVVANRGANGIDGVVSTAVGLRRPAGPVPARWSAISPSSTTSVACCGRRRAAIDCTFVVVDNDGGGIFSFLPQATEVPEARFERFFGTAHGVELPALAAAYGIPATSIAKLDELAGALTADGVHVVHVRTDRSKNVAVHEEIHAAVAAQSGPDHGGQEGLQLELGLGQFSRGVGVGHDADARQQAGLVASEVGRADADRPDAVSTGVDPSHRPGVAPPVEALSLGDVSDSVATGPPCHCRSRVQEGRPVRRRRGSLAACLR